MFTGVSFFICSIAVVSLGDGEDGFSRASQLLAFRS
jgi:hypothetical protein